MKEGFKENGEGERERGDILHGSSRFLIILSSETDPTYRVDLRCPSQIRSCFSDFPSTPPTRVPPPVPVKTLGFFLFLAFIFHVLEAFLGVVLGASRAVPGALGEEIR